MRSIVPAAWTDRLPAPPLGHACHLHHSGWKTFRCPSRDVLEVLKVEDRLLVELLANRHRKRKNHPPAGKDIAASSETMLESLGFF